MKKASLCLNFEEGVFKKIVVANPKSVFAIEN
jgi:hypothetical protein